MPSPCPVCGGPHRHDETIVRDPHYHGPRGHAPQKVCLDCYADAWESPDNIKNRQLAAIILLGEGYSRQQAGEIVGRSLRTIQYWIAAWRQNPDAFLALIAQIEPSRVRHK